MTDPHDVSALRPAVLGAPPEPPALPTVAAWRWEHALATIATAAAVYITQSSSNAVLFTIGLRPEAAIGGSEDAP